MQKPIITAWLKKEEGIDWPTASELARQRAAFEDKDIIQNPAFRWEMEQKSGQPLSPCVEINGTMLPDISGEEVEAWMLANNVVTQNNITPDAPINQPCAHEMPQSSPLNFAVRR